MIMQMDDWTNISPRKVQQYPAPCKTSAADFVTFEEAKKNLLTNILSTGGNHFWGSQETLCSSYTHSSRSSHLDSPLLSSAFHPVKNCSLKEKYVRRSFEYTIKIFVNPKKFCLIKAQKSTPARHIDRVAPDVILGLASTNLYRRNL